VANVGAIKKVRTSVDRATRSPSRGPARTLSIRTRPAATRGRPDQAKIINFGILVLCHCFARRVKRRATSSETYRDDDRRYRCGLSKGVWKPRQQRRLSRAPAPMQTNDHSVRIDPHKSLILQPWSTVHGVVFDILLSGHRKHPQSSDSLNLLPLRSDQQHPAIRREQGDSPRCSTRPTGSASKLIWRDGRPMA